MMMPQTETPVAIMFREWLILKRKWEAALAGDLSDDMSNAWCKLVYAASDAVLDAPSTGPADFVMKLFAQTFDGEHEIGDCPRGAEIWAEARSLIEQREPAPESGQSPLRALCGQWQEAKAAYRAMPIDAPEAEDDAAYWHMVSFEEAASAYEPRTLDDWAVKVIFADDNGAMQGTIFQEALAAQAYRIAGIEPQTRPAAQVNMGVVA